MASVTPHGPMMEVMEKEEEGGDDHPVKCGRKWGRGGRSHCNDFKLASPAEDTQIRKV
jgi:hypothetical protein